MNARTLVFCLFAFVASVGLGVIATGCGESTSESSYTCCVNGSFYECPDAESMNQCVDQCDRDSSRDNECED